MVYCYITQVPIWQVIYCSTLEVGSVFDCECNYSSKKTTTTFSMVTCCKLVSLVLFIVGPIVGLIIIRFKIMLQKHLVMLKKKTDLLIILINKLTFK